MARRARPRPPATSDLPILAALFCLYVLAGKASLATASAHPGAAAGGLSTGIALAAILVLGYRSWPAMFAGAVIVNLSTAGALAPSLGVAVGNTLEGMLGAYLVNRFANGVRAFGGAKNIFKFAGLAGGLSPFVGATIGVSCLRLAGYASGADLTRGWLTWWLADAVGVMIATPLLVLWARTSSTDLVGARRLERAGLFLATILVGTGVFGGGPLFGVPGSSLAFLCAPVLLWGACRFGQREVATQIAVLSAVAIGQALRGSGPLMGTSAHDSVLLAQAVIATMSMVVLPMAALVEERRRIGQEREEMLAREQVAREETLGANRVKDEFLGMFGYELRNPLAVMIGALSVLERMGNPDEVAVRARGAIRHQITHLSRLIDDLLDVAGVTGGKIVLARRPLNLATGVERSVRALADTGRLERHAVDVHVEPVWLNGDPARLDQIVCDLLTNAVKYTPPGGAIRVRVEEEGDEAVIRVEDTGVGIGPDLLPRIFDLFAQDPGGPDRGQGELGVGLALVRRLVQLHGGRVEASSDGPGCGSKIIVRLPRIGAPRPEADRVTPAESPAVQRRRVLIVDDSADARKMLRIGLELAGHEVLMADDGYRALNIAAIQRPDVALINTALPGMDGYEVARRLRTTIAGAEMRLLALVVRGQPFDHVRGLDFDAQLMQPVDPRELARTVSRMTSAADPVSGLFTRPKSAGGHAPTGSWRAPHRRGDRVATPQP